MSLLAFSWAISGVASPAIAACCGMLAWRWRRASGLAEERARQLAAARDAHERHGAFLAAVLEQLPGRILVTDTTGDLLFANDAVRTEPIGPRLYELDAETPLEHEHLPLVRALRGERVSDVEVVCFPPGAPEPRRLLCSASPVLDAGGALLGAVNTATDITKRREAEMRLAEVNLVLRAVRAATHDIAEDGGDVAHAICQATRLASGAGLVMLYQPDGDGDLVTTGAVGYDGELPIRLPIAAGEPTAVATAHASGRPVFAPDAGAHPDASTGWARRLGLASVLLQPILGAEAIGVLAVGWREPVTAIDEPAAMSIQLLAAEAAVAIERADLIGRLRELSLRDPLTGLPNRRAWDDDLARELSRARRSGQPLCVALIDLDHFKSYNDEKGHQRGDVLLRSAAAAWAMALRDTDVVARWGGEEFAVCLPNCSPPEAEAVLTRLRSLIPDGQTCSVGMAAWDGDELPDGLLGRADQALYRAKDGGRDRLVAA